MAELKSRRNIESAFADQFAKLSDEHRRELKKLLGNPPDPANVPSEFWDRVRKSEEDALVPALFSIFFASASQHGRKYGLDNGVIQDAANEWSLKRSKEIADERAKTSQEMLETAKKDWAEKRAEARRKAIREGLGKGPKTVTETLNELKDPVGKKDADDRAEKIFGKDRSKRFITNEVTGGVTGGSEFAMGAAGQKNEYDTWFTERDDSVCPICAPLHRMWRSVTDSMHPIAWGDEYPQGPPAPHPHCRCHISYVADRESGRGRKSPAVTVLKKRFSERIRRVFVKKTSLQKPNSARQNSAARVRNGVSRNLTFDSFAAFLRKNFDKGEPKSVDPRVAKLQEQFSLPNEIQGLPLEDFVVFEDVPLIDTFEDTDINATPAFLQKIVSVNNERTLDTGDMAPLILGHTDDEKPETEQPPIVGWALNYKLKNDFGRLNPRPAVLGTMLIHKSLEKTIRQKFPRRSVEVFDDGLIDPIALLGATTPRRSLSLLTESGSGRKAVALRKNHSRWKFSATELCYDNHLEQSQMDENKIADIVSKAIDAHPIGQMARKFMEGEEPTVVPDVPNPDAGTPPAQMEGEEDKKKQGDTPPAQMEGDVPVGDAGSGGVNPEEASEVVQALVDATTPDEVKAAMAKLGAIQKAAKLKKALSGSRPTSNGNVAGDDKSKLETGQLKTRLAQAERRLEAFEKRERETATKLRHEERKSALIQLESEGYDFDRAEEFDSVKDMTDDQFKAYLSRVQKNYRRVPVGSPPVKLSALSRGSDIGEGDVGGTRQEREASEEKKIQLARKKRMEAHRLGKKMDMFDAYKEAELELSQAS